MQLQAFSGGELVDADGAPITLQRQAWRLALFVGTRSGRRATTDEIVDALWGDTPPATARETVHVLVNRIRRAAGASTLELTPGGYRLNVDLDLDDVLTAFDDARRLEPTDPDAAATVLRAALDRSTAPPFGSFGQEPWLADIVLAFGERRRREEEHWAALRIRLGTAPDVIEEFRAATGDQPLREVRWEHLMLALYRAGRQADALRAYDDARAHLQSSLGVDPGPALRRLHRAILDHDVPPEGSFPAPPATSHRWEPLVGRTTELQRMEQLVTRGRLVTVTGIGGVGKSRLVDEYAYRRLLAGAHTHILGVLPGHTTEELARLLIATAERSLLQGDADLLDIAVVLASALDLLVIDGAERAPDAAVGLIDHLIGHCPNLRVVATSRQPLRTATEVLLPLDGLDLASGRESAAHQLFAERLGVDLTAAGPEDLERFDAEVVRTGGIPILIELAAATFDPDAVDAARRGAGDASVREAIDDALMLVEPGAAVLMDTLALVPGALNLATVSALIADDTLTRRYLHQLRGVRLIITETGPAGRRYRTLDPIADELAARLGPNRIEAILAALTPCLGDRFHGFRPIPGGPLHPDLLPGLDDEYENLDAVIEHHLRVGNGTAVIELVDRATWYLWHRSLVDPTLRQVERALACDDVSLAARATGLCALAEILGDSFRVAALVEHFQAILEDPQVRALDRNLLGKVHLWTALGRGVRGDLDGADELIDAATEIVADDPWLRAQHAQLRAYRLAASGEFDAARVRLRECSIGFETLGDLGAAATSFYLAAVIGDLVDSPTARADIGESRRRAAEFGSDRMLARLDFLEASIRSRDFIDPADVTDLLDIGERLERTGSLRMSALVRRNVALALLPDAPERAAPLLVPAVSRLLAYDLAAAALGLAGIAHLLPDSPARVQVVATAWEWWEAPQVPTSVADKRAWEALDLAAISPRDRTAVVDVDQIRARLAEVVIPDQ